MANTGSAEALRAAYFESVLDNTHFRPAQLADLAGILEQEGIEPLTFKGWSLARYYAPPAYRPLGDIDLCVPAERYADAANLIAAQSTQSGSGSFRLGENSTTLMLESPRMRRMGIIDLQSDLARFRLEPLSGVFERSRQVEVAGGKLRIPSPEDHLRLLCLHFLEHGGWRPLWLCDVAAMLEAEADGFDWNLCLGDDPVTSHWICMVIALAHRLLDAKLGSLPEKYRETKLPAWVIPTVLRQWSKPFSQHAPPKLFSHTLRSTPYKFGSALSARWPDPIAARFQAGRCYDDRPHWPYQAAYFLRKGTTFAGRIFSNLSRR